LWVSAALIGAYTAGYQKFEQLSLSPIVLTIIIVAFFLSVIAFGICLYAIPARKGYQSVHQEGWGEFSHNAYNLLCAKNGNLYAAFLTDFISKFDIAHKHSLETNQKRAKLLRLTSWFLIVSFILAILGLSTIAINYSQFNLSKENIMTESNDNAPSSGTENQPVSTDKPNVPVPPPPAGSQGGQIHTHSAKKKKIIRATEDVGTKSKE